jgi:hypothetical protein
MRYTIYEKATGMIVSLLTGPDGISEINTPEGCDNISGHYDYFTQYVVNGNVTERPTTGLPTEHTITTNTDWIIADVPAGTEVEIDGEVVAVTDDTELTLNFRASGIWPVTLRPPFPWVEASCEVTVT